MPMKSAASGSQASLCERVGTARGQIHEGPALREAGPMSGRAKRLLVVVPRFVFTVKG